MIFSILHIHPIIIPQRKITDRFNNPNAYIEMNPSMFITDAGDVTILVRNINYRKFYDKSFVIFDNISNSLYSIIKCKIWDKVPLNLENSECSLIKYYNNLPIYNTYWKGLEDIRFINATSILAIIPECNKDGNPCIFRATINVDEQMIHSFKPCFPNKIEKNWMPYNEKNAVEKVVYKLNPFTIKSIDHDNTEVINTSLEQKEVLRNYNGSTNGIPYNGAQLFLIHTNKEKSYHRWLLFNTETSEIIISNEFVFFNHSYIEFPCSLCKYNERIFVSIGINDDKAFIIEIEPSEISHSLTT
jgi:hypothetical protein